MDSIGFAGLFQHLHVLYKSKLCVVEVSKYFVGLICVMGSTRVFVGISVCGGICLCTAGPVWILPCETVI